LLGLLGWHDIGGHPRCPGTREWVAASVPPHEGYRRGTPLPAQALPAMRVVLLQSAIQNPKSRIQNRVSALRRSELGHGHGQAIGAGIDDSAPWKTEETIIDLSQLPALSGFSRFGGCHLSAPLSPFSSRILGDLREVCAYRRRPARCLVY